MISARINEYLIFIKPKTSILEATKFAGIILPRFCYHELLSLAGNCRMCIVFLESVEKPVAACVTEIENNMQILTNTPAVKKSRETIMEALLLNHPLDCPICDQGGECDLQDQAKKYGVVFSKFFFKKKKVEDKFCGPLIKTIMTRCIHCTRCVRFSTELSSSSILGPLNRGGAMEIGNYNFQFLNSEISGNIIDICPVGALTAKDYAFKGRPWELKTKESIDLTDSLGSSIYTYSKELELIRITPKSNNSINESLISDNARFLTDFYKKNRLNFLQQNDNTILSIKDLLYLFSLKKKKNILFLINNNIDFNIIKQLKIYSLINSINIKLKTVVSNKNSKFLFYKEENIISDIVSFKRLAIYLSVNLKLECSVLNAKIRNLYRNNFFHNISLGQSYENTETSILFLNLNFKNIINFFEGKDKALCKLIKKQNSPLIFIGQAFINNFKGFLDISFFFKKYIANAKIFKILNSNNYNSIKFLNIKNYKKNDLLKNKNLICCINLEDNIFLRKELFFFIKNVFWFNTHESLLSLKSKIKIPLSTEYDYEGIFLNLENRPQKTGLLFAEGSKYKNPQELLMFLINYDIKNIFFINFILEQIKNKNLFNKLTKNFIYKKQNYLINKVLKSPSKPAINEIAANIIQTKNSLILNKNLKYKEKKITNFYPIKNI